MAEKTVNVTRIIEGTAGIAIIAALGFSSWLASHEAQIRASATEQAQSVLVANSQQAIKQQQLQIQALTDSIKQMQLNEAKQLSAIQSQFRAAQTPQQIADLISSQMNLKQPIQIVVPSATKDNPAPAPVAQVPLADAPQAKDYVQQCEECKAQVQVYRGIAGALQQASDDKDAELKAKDQTIAAFDAERNAWKKASKGTFWSRLQSKAKWFAIGGAFATGALCGTGHCR